MRQVPNIAAHRTRSEDAINFGTRSQVILSTPFPPTSSCIRSSGRVRHRAGPRDRASLGWTTRFSASLILDESTARVPEPRRKPQLRISGHMVMNRDARLSRATPSRSPGSRRQRLAKEASSSDASMPPPRHDDEETSELVLQAERVQGLSWARLWKHAATTLF